MSNHLKHYAGCNLIPLERLNLRPLTLNDDAAVYALRSHPEIFKYVDIKPYEDIPRAQRFIRAVTKDIEEEEGYFWGIARKEDDRIIGTVCLWNFNDEYTSVELGYELHPDFHHNGYMREAVEAVIKFVSGQTSLKVIEAITHKDNTSSVKLLDYFGFEKLGIADDLRPWVEEGPDMVLYQWIIKHL